MRRNMFGASPLGLTAPFGAPGSLTTPTSAATASTSSQPDPDFQYLGTSSNGLLFGDPKAAPAAAGESAPAPGAPAAAAAPDPIVSTIPDVNAAQSQVSLVPNLNAWIARGRAEAARIFGKGHKADLKKLKDYCIAAGMDMREFMAGDTVCAHAYPMFKRFPDIQDLIEAVDEARARYNLATRPSNPGP